MSGRPGTSSGHRSGTGSGARPGTGQGLNPIVRPGTGQRSSLGSSAGRPLTGRLGTGQAVPATPGQTAGFGVSLNTEVNVSDRPVTQQGMMGMRMGTAGPGRQVQNASFFMGKLHAKTSEITSEMEKLHKEMSFKERQLESSVTTKQRLTMELQKRQAELDKVNTLDTKISLELSSLLQKMDTMTSDMAEFAKLDELKETHGQTKQYLQRMKQQYIRRRDAMKQQVNVLSAQLENLKQETANHDTDSREVVKMPLPLVS